MTIERWLAASTADARRRGLDDLVPLLESLAAALQTLRNADFNDDASGAEAAHDGTASRKPGGTHAS